MIASSEDSALSTLASPSLGQPRDEGPGELCWWNDQRCSQGQRWGLGRSCTVPWNTKDLLNLFGMGSVYLLPPNYLKIWCNFCSAQNYSLRGNEIWKLHRVFFPIIWLLSLSQPSFPWKTRCPPVPFLNWPRGQWGPLWFQRSRDASLSPWHSSWMVTINWEPRVYMATEMCN